MPELLAIAEQVTNLSAVCRVCGNNASRSQRTLSHSGPEKNESQIVVGAAELYEARCRFCHEPNSTGVPASEMGLPVIDRKPKEPKEKPRKERDAVAQT